MTTQTYTETKHGLVQELRKIRDQVSTEIKDMTFEEERAYLDKLLSNSNSKDSSIVQDIIETEKKPL